MRDSNRHPLFLQRPGPGGAWVNAAKLALFSEVAIDLPAGPSEVTVWAEIVVAQWSGITKHRDGVRIVPFIRLGI